MTVSNVFSGDRAGAENGANHHLRLADRTSDPQWKSLHEGHAAMILGHPQHLPAQCYDAVQIAPNVWRVARWVQDLDLVNFEFQTVRGVFTDGMDGFGFSAAHHVIEYAKSRGHMFEREARQINPRNPQVIKSPEVIEGER
jgi:hypothetical protein